jgi:hypothetical protein
MSLVTATGPGSTYNPEMDGQYLVVQPLLLVPLRMVCSPFRCCFAVAMLTTGLQWACRSWPQSELRVRDPGLPYFGVP